MTRYPPPGPIFAAINEPKFPVDMLPHTSRVEPVDPNIDERDEKRITGQNARVLDMLRRGEVTVQMALAENITRLAARIHDLEKAGHSILRRRMPDGCSAYRLPTSEEKEP